jgi:amidase
VTLAVKDVIDVAGTVTGAGNPTYAARQAPAVRSAAAVEALVAAGAAVVGKTVTDELAYSLSGTNVHHGTPRNPAAPGRIPGGSSAGSAAAVAAGLCDLALGTDTGGSIRVPASYCGIVGWRPTHGAVATDGIVHLARSFDTVGLLARSPALLATAAAVLLAPDAPNAPAVSDQVDMATLELDLDRCVGAFRVLQGFEAWREHGAWITDARPELGPGIAARFAAASRVTADEAAAAQEVRDQVRRAVTAATADGRVLVGPAAGGAAPRIDEPASGRDATRLQTLRTTCVAGLAGAPVVVLPLDHDHGLPLGVACMGAPGTDRALLAWAVGRMAP